jgi:NAD(P)-dependent dehydrogenase (short-subunit alcohol dehydrogenase family)
MAIDLSGKTCLVTGADEGLGRGLVEGFAIRGAQVVAGLRDEKSAAPLPPGVLPVAMDVTNSAQVQNAVSQAIEKFGRLDALINNAGIYPRRHAVEISFEDWRKILDVNLDGAWRCCVAVLPQFQKQNSGVIVNVGSIEVRNGAAQHAHYQASKAALVGLTRALARDLGKFNVRVNCVHPGAIETEGERRLIAAIGDTSSEEVLKLCNEKQCLPGRQTPRTIEPVFAFLISDESGDITGQCLTADRGWTHD